MPALLRRRSLLATPAAFAVSPPPAHPAPVSLLATKINGVPASCAELSHLLQQIASHAHPKIADLKREAAEIGETLHARKQISDRVEQDPITAEALQSAARGLLELVLASVGFAIPWTQLLCSHFGLQQGDMTIQAFLFPQATAGAMQCVVLAGPERPAGPLRLALLCATQRETGQGGIHDCAQRIVLGVAEAVAALPDSSKRCIAQYQLQKAVRTAGQLEAALAAALGNQAKAQAQFAANAAAHAWLPNHLLHAYHGKDCAIPAMKADPLLKPAQDSKACPQPGPSP